MKSHVIQSRLPIDLVPSSQLSLHPQVKTYFNTSGYERWKKIYGETDEVNKVQMDIRTGHAMTVEKVLTWIDGAGGMKGVTVADCGCGTGERYTANKRTVDMVCPANSANSGHGLPDMPRT